MSRIKACARLRGSRFCTCDSFLKREVLRNRKVVIGVTRGTSIILV